MDGTASKQIRSPWTHLLIAVLVTPVTGVAVFWLSLYAMATLADSWQPVWLGDSSNAQIVVLASGHSPDGLSAELIPLSSAAEYTSAHPGCTFLIPPDRKEKVQEQLKADLKLSWFTFDVNPISDGKEEITLYFMDRTDDSHGSRYKASKDNVQLESHRYAADRGAIGVLLYAMILTFGIHVLVLGFLLIRAVYFWRRKRCFQEVAAAQS